VQRTTVSDQYVTHNSYGSCSIETYVFVCMRRVSTFDQKATLI